MKKIVLLVMVIGFLSMVACKKDRACECKVGKTVFKIELNDVGKRQAKDACISQTYYHPDGTIDKYECELK